MSEGFAGSVAGDVIHFESYYSLQARVRLEDVWAFVDESLGNGRSAITPLSVRDGFDGETIADKSDFGRVVPPDEVPDHVWQALALVRLTGELDAPNIEGEN